MKRKKTMFAASGLAVLATTAWGGGGSGAGGFGQEVPPDFGVGGPESGGPFGDSFVETCRTDLDGSGVIDFPDLIGVLSDWGSCVVDHAGGETPGDERRAVRRTCAGDINKSNEVDFEDLLLVMNVFGLECSDLRTIP